VCPASREPAPRAYHHGDLRRALIEASIEIIGEAGIQNFSVAAAARRTGVSPGAPYRHFVDRDALLAAVAIQAAGLLEKRYRAAVAKSSDPVEKLAQVTTAYVRFAAGDGQAGFEVIYAAGLNTSEYAELREHRRVLSDIVLPITFEIVPEGASERAVSLFQAQAALAHGYAMLLRDGFFRVRKPTEVVARAADATRALASSYQT
jgi:AcrR family transcriptional regulator